MHDPDVVVFDLHLPVPVEQKWRRGHGPRWALVRRRYSGPTDADRRKALEPWFRPNAYDLWVAGREFVWWKVATVWHGEPGGRDSGTVCKGLRGSHLSAHNLRWAWQHRAHLSVRVLPYRRVRSWLFDRCDHCGHRFRWKRDARFSYQGTDKVWHGPCSAERAWRAKADERMTVLDLICDVWGVTSSDVQALAEGRVNSGKPYRSYEDANARNLAWRVMYDLEKHREASTTKEPA